MKCWIDGHEFTVTVTELYQTLWFLTRLCHSNLLHLLQNHNYPQNRFYCMYILYYSLKSKTHLFLSLITSQTQRVPAEVTFRLCQSSTMLRYVHHPVTLHHHHLLSPNGTVPQSISGPVAWNSSVRQLSFTFEYLISNLGFKLGISRDLQLSVLSFKTTNQKKTCRNRYLWRFECRAGPWRLCIDSIPSWFFIWQNSYGTWSAAEALHPRTL